jgi:hypothetical protein
MKVESITSEQEEKGDVMKGKKPLRNRNGKDLLRECDYRQHVEIYGEKVPSIFAAASPQDLSSRNESPEVSNRAKDVDMGFNNNGLK